LKKNECKIKKKVKRKINNKKSVKEILRSMKSKDYEKSQDNKLIKDSRNSTNKPLKEEDFCIEDMKMPRKEVIKL